MGISLKCIQISKINMETPKFEEIYKSPECTRFLVKTNMVLCQSQQPEQTEKTTEEELF